MKTKNPYGAEYDVLVPPQTIEKEQAQASKKARARYPNPPLGPGLGDPETGKPFRRALTPGTTPTNS